MRSLLFLLTVLATGCTREALTGDGQVKTEQRAVESVSELQVDLPAEVEVRQGEREALSLQADENLLPEISSVVDGGRLKLTTVRPSVELRPSKPIVVRLEIKQLSSISLAGSGKVRFARLSGEQLSLNCAGSGSIEGGGLTLAALTATLTGSGSMRLDGAVPDMQLNVSGAGSFAGEQLRTEKATVNLVGSGSATVSVKQQLTANIAGSGNLRYLGDPAVQQNVTGSGKVTKAAK